MDDDSGLRHRRSIRLPAYDYSRDGGYFVTICTQGRLCLLADFGAGELPLNPAGKRVADIWESLPGRFPGLLLDEFIVMPNHVHAVLILTPATTLQPNAGRGDPCDRPGPINGTLPGTVGRIVQAFKSLTTHAYTLGVKNQGWPIFPGKLWQRNYYERIVRGRVELGAVRRYIRDNPARWPDDAENLGR